MTLGIGLFVLSDVVFIVRALNPHVAKGLRWKTKISLTGRLRRLVLRDAAGDGALLMGDDDLHGPFATLPFQVESDRPRRPIAGRLVSATGWLTMFGVIFGTFLVMIVVGALVEGFFDDDWIGVAWVFASVIFMMILGIPIWPWCIRRIALGRQMRAPRAFDLLQGKSKPPVLLLRSFNDDDLIDPSYMARARTVPARYEEQLVAALRRLGPVIALGRPGEAQPLLGAARLYVKDEDWQRAIFHFMDRAVAVIAVVGPTEGLWWEIGAAIEHVPPERLLLFFPYPIPPVVRGSYWRRTFMQNPVVGRWLRRKYYPMMERERQMRFRTFRQRFAEHFRQPLPEALGMYRFLQFDVAGRPELLPPVKPTLAVRIFTMNWRGQIDVPFARELRPFVTNLSCSRLAEEQ